MWGCDVLAAGIGAYGIACAVVLPPKGPSERVRASIEKRLAGTALVGVTDCVLCSSVHVGWMVGLLLSACGLAPWAAGLVVVPGVAAALAALRAGSGG